MANKPKQTAPADFYVGFTGAAAQMNVTEPQLGQQVEYTVVGTVTGTAETIRDDGETRMAVKVSIESAWAKGQQRPDIANQSLLFDHKGDATGEATGDEDEVDEYDQDDPANAKADA